MAITVEDAITKLTTGYWNKNARTEANPGGFGANGHVDNLPALAEALGVVGEFAGTQGDLAAEVLAIQAQINAVVAAGDDIVIVAEDIAAVLAAAANMAAIIAAPTHAATATTKATEAADSATAALGFRNEAQAAAAGVTLPSITAGDSGKALLVNPEGTGYLVGKVASLPALITENTTLAAGQSYRVGGSSALTLTLPADPAAGDAILLVDGESISATVQHTIARNGQTIMGLAENLTLNVRGIALQLWFTGTTWRLF
jgi:hypothetical protein